MYDASSRLRSGPVATPWLGPGPLCISYPFHLSFLRILFASEAQADKHPSAWSPPAWGKPKWSSRMTCSLYPFTVYISETLIRHRYPRVLRITPICLSRGCPVQSQLALTIELYVCLSSTSFDPMLSPEATRYCPHGTAHRARLQSLVDARATKWMTLSSVLDSLSGYM